MGRHLACSQGGGQAGVALLIAGVLGWTLAVRPCLTLLGSAHVPGTSEPMDPGGALKLQNVELLCAGAGRSSTIKARAAIQAAHWEGSLGTRPLSALWS